MLGLLKCDASVLNRAATLCGYDSMDGHSRIGLGTVRRSSGKSPR